MIYNLEPLDRTIAAIIRNLKLGDKQIPYQDFVEWIADGLEHIGAYYQLHEKGAVINVTNHQGLLPCDLHKMIAIKDGFAYTEDKYSGFFGGSAQDILEKNIPDLFVVDPATGKTPYDNMTAYEKFRVLAVGGLSVPYNQFEASKRQLLYDQGMIGNVGITGNYNNGYKINGNVITTMQPNAIFYITYLAFPVDERGWPLVPDSVSYRDALFWKCAYQLSMSNPELLTNPDMKKIDYNYNKWNFYCVQARNEAMMPDPQMMSRIANNWMSFLGTNYHNNNWVGSGLPLGLNLQGNR